MTKKLLFLVLVLLIVSCKVQRAPISSPKSNNISSLNRTEYIKNYKDLAIKEMNRSQIPASITLAQALLESDNGNSTLAQKSNNHFGIKCHSGWRGNKVYHDDDKRNECFRKYKTVYKSYKDHSNFIVNGPRYAFLFEYNPTDYKSWSKGLQKAGYATSKSYATMLIKIIEDNQLYIFDKGGTLTNETYSAVDSQEVVLADIDNFKIYTEKHRVYNKNRIDYIIAKKGDTFNSISEELGMLSWELFKYNELEENAKLMQGQILFIQPKRNKAEHGLDFHEVMNGESMYAISQMYGMKIKKLYEKNLMDVGDEPKVGQKLWLRNFKTHTDVIEETPIIEDFDE
ncbi:MAG: glucosaminidase domain-containing protein [Bacteroidales bacterium]|jgi:LysM repeat protein|nr:glucosaminidase domain-containing protein [Bacteroidales bacterium]